MLKKIMSIIDRRNITGIEYLLIVALIVTIVISATSCTPQPTTPQWSQTVVAVGDGQSYDTPLSQGWPSHLRDRGVPIDYVTTPGYGLDASLLRGNYIDRIIQRVNDDGCPRAFVIMVGSADFNNWNDSGLFLNYNTLNEAATTLGQFLLAEGCDTIWVAPPPGSDYSWDWQTLMDRTTYATWLTSQSWVTHSIEVLEFQQPDFTLSVSYAENEIRLNDLAQRVIADRVQAELATI